MQKRIFDCDQTSKEDFALICSLNRLEAGARVETANSDGNFIMQIDVVLSGGRCVLAKVGKTVLT